MNRYKKALDATLPPTTCSQEMRDQMILIAQTEGKSIADIQRKAFALFLSKSDRLAIENSSTALQEAT